MINLDKHSNGGNLKKDDCGKAQSYTRAEQFEIANCWGSKHCTIGWMDPDLWDTTFLIAGLAESREGLSCLVVRSNIKDLDGAIFESSNQGVFSFVDIDRSNFFTVKVQSASKLAVHFKVKDCQLAWLFTIEQKDLIFWP